MTGLPAGQPLAVLVVRDGGLPLGADETVAEAGGNALLVGSRPGKAVADLVSARCVWIAETGDFAPAALAAGLRDEVLHCGPIVLPGSPDGRDVAPRLAAALGRPLLAGAVRVTGDGAEVVRWGGQMTVDLVADGPFVATLQPGVRGSEPAGQPATTTHLSVDIAAAGDARSRQTLAPDPATADLAEAPRILSAGAGLGGADRVALLSKVAASLGASLGATRVVTDAGWTGHERQIGTTGVLVNPRLYVAFGVSGATQHIGGIGAPDTVISVNSDPSCPMTAMADLGIVTDAPALVAELAARLGVSSG